MAHLECHFIAKGRTNVELREKFILPEGTTQVMASFRYRGRRSRPSSRGASPNRSTSSQSCAVPSAPAVTSTPKVGGSALLWETVTLLCFTLWLWLTVHFPTMISLLFLYLIPFVFPFFDQVPVHFLCFFHLVFLVVFDLWIHICVFWFAIVSQTPQHITRNYDKPWLTNSKPSTPLKSSDSFGSQGSSSEV